MTTILHILQFSVEPQMLSKFNAWCKQKSTKYILGVDLSVHIKLWS